jgi:hypothetical protein
MFLRILQITCSAPKFHCAWGLLLGYNRRKLKENQMILNEDEFYQDKAQSLAEKEIAINREKEALAKIEKLKLDTQLEAAYAEAGGITSGEDADAFQTIKSLLKTEIKDGEIVLKDQFGEIEKNADGTAKSVRQKMRDLRRNPTLKGFFSNDAENSQEESDSQQVAQQSYTREDARKGKANINDIASGKIQLEGAEDSRKPDTRKVNADNIANMKTRKW